MTARWAWVIGLAAATATVPSAHQAGSPAARFAVPPDAMAGLTPPSGLALDYACSCFQTSDGAVTITITAVRAPYAQFETGFADYWRRKGMIAPVREPLRVSGRAAFLLHGDLVEAGRTTHVAVLVADGPRAVVTVVAQVPSDRRAAFPGAAMLETLRRVELFELGQATARRDAVPYVVGDDAGFRFQHANAGIGSDYADGQSRPATSDFAHIRITAVPSGSTTARDPAIAGPSGASLRGEAPRGAWQPEGESAFDAGPWRWTVREASGYNPNVPTFRKQLRLRRAVFVGVHPRGTLQVEATYLDSNAAVMAARVARFVRGLDIP
jgi:hypothetical protein